MKYFFTVETLHTVFPCLVIGATIFWSVLLFGHYLHFYLLSIRDPRKESLNSTKIKEENDLMNHRLTWLLTAEGLLFTALGFALSKGAQSFSGDLIAILSLVGVVLAASAGLVLHSANGKILELMTVEKPNREEKSEDDNGEEVESEENNRDHENNGWCKRFTLCSKICTFLQRYVPIFDLLAPWRVFPILFIGAWYLVSQMEISEDPSPPPTPPSSAETPHPPE